MSITAPTPTSDATVELVSIGRLAGTLQRSTREISYAARCAGVSPAMRLNDVAYFGIDDVEQITAWFRTHTDQQGASPCDQAGGQPLPPAPG